MFIQYAPLRQLVGGSGSNGKLEFEASRFDESYKDQGNTATAISGKSETTLLRIDYTSMVDSGPVPIVDESKWREFHASVAAGEQFTLDAFGTEASPVAPKPVKLQQKSFKKTRLSPQYLSYSFTVIEV